MIKVTITRRAHDRRIASFAVKGHAEYAKPGKDIVCAGVSAITVGTVNAIEALAGVKLPAAMTSGWLSSDIPELANKTVDEKLQLQLESMVVMLETIERSYGKNVVIQEKLVQ